MSHGFGVFWAATKLVEVNVSCSLHDLHPGRSCSSSTTEAASRYWWPFHIKWTGQVDVPTEDIYAELLSGRRRKSHLAADTEKRSKTFERWCWTIKAIRV